MKIWFNKLQDSRRSFIELTASEVSIGRDATCDVVLPSPLVSRKHAVVRINGEKMELENVGLNSCVVGQQEVFGGQVVSFGLGDRLRIWPYTITFEQEAAPTLSRAEVEIHIRTQLADLELEIHKQLLARLDLVEVESQGQSLRERVLLLENHIEDICRELGLFHDRNEGLLAEIAGVALRDLLIHQLVMEADWQAPPDLAMLTSNEFDVPATLVPERETELHALLHHMRTRLELKDEKDADRRIERVEKGYADVSPLIRPHLHGELRKYLIQRTLKKDLKDTVFGFGPLQDLLRAPNINEIMVVAHDQIYFEREGVIELSGRRFLSPEVTEAIIERIVAQVGRRIDKSQPLVDARLPDGSRVNAIIPPLAVRGPCLTIRKFGARQFTIDSLIERGSITRPAAEFLRACVINERNILVCGGTGSGKTTLLNILSSFIPHRQRIVTIEDTTELKLLQDHVVSLESKPANVEGTGAYTIRDLLKNALRMRPDRIIVGECRGPEALDMLQAMNTGHDGSLTTVHANSAEEVLQRLEVLVLMAADLPVTAIHRQIESAVDLVVHISRVAGGRRLVTEIAEIDGVNPEDGRVRVRDIFNLRGTTDSLQPTGYLPSFVEELVNKNLLEPKFLYARQTNQGPATNGRQK
ncbi:MAG TPA: ATPase, T2SS/T4P/T4SS family [Pirellulaceae bacterium]|jgi:pilus assembly protein CpaF